MSEKILCPKCVGDEVLELHTLPGNIEVDYCSSCEGLWFDQGEMSQKLEFSKDFPDFQTVLKEAHTTDHSCPRCQDKRLVEMKFLPEDPLLIDYCPGCKGIWLDGGEINSLEKLSKRDDNKKISLLKAVYQLKNKVGRGKAYRCPDCKGQNMYTIESGERVFTEFCQDCKGVWFDAGEIADTVELSSDIPEFNVVYKLKKPTDKACPKCVKSQLVEFPFTTKTDLMLDYCEGCKGIWLDSAELARIEDIAPELEALGDRLKRIKKKYEDEGYLILS